MSYSNSDGRATATLRTSGGVGVEIEIADAESHVWARGTETLEAVLPEGIYRVRWTAGTETDAQLVRLLPIAQPLVVEPPKRFAGAAVADAPDTATDDNDDEAAPNQPATTDHGAEIVVHIQAASPEERRHFVKTLRLISGTDVAMRGDTAARMAVRTPSGRQVLRFYRVPPGNYRLRFVSLAGESVEQTVPAITGRRTIVCLSGKTAMKLSAVGDAFRPEERQGIETRETVMASVPKIADEAAVSSLAEENLRLARILLDNLAAGSGSLSAGFCVQLDADAADPLLRLYAAAVILMRLEAKASPALDDTWPAEDAAAFIDRWQQMAVRWAAAAAAWQSPDAVAVLWELHHRGVAVPEIVPEPVPETVPETIAGQVLPGAPMLECAWGWAVRHSVTVPAAVPAEGVFRVIARDAGGNAPWLVWRPAAAIGSAVPVPETAAFDMVGAIGSVANTVARMVAEQSASGYVQKFKALSPVAQAIANSSYQAVADTFGRATSTLETKSFGGDSASPDPSPGTVTSTNTGAQYVMDTLDSIGSTAMVKGLVEKLSIPSQLLQDRLTQTLRELDASMAPDQAKARAPKKRPPPPGLLRSVTHPDDPQKGRFGGKPSAGGFRVGATFEPGGEGWLYIHLRVQASAAEKVRSGPVEFCLHDSFRPNQIVEDMKDGVAVLTVAAWGGFTVGVWLAEPEVELELDLSRLRSAPDIIRSL